MVRTLALCALTLVLVACEGPGPIGGSYYEERIAPTLEVGCAMQLSGCHIANEVGSAAGNLDLTSYDSLMRRQDALPAYGPYPEGLFLLKAVGPVEVAVQTLDPPDPSRPDELFVNIVTDIRHAGGAVIERGSPGHGLLREWIGRGFQRNGATVSIDSGNRGGCVDTIGDAAGFDPAAEPTDSEAFSQFVDRVQPMLRERCAGSSCHGAALADLHLACGDSEVELRWNYFISTAHLGDPVANSEMLRRPLSPLRGGAFHGGGETFETEEDPGYRTLLEWAELRVANEPASVVGDDLGPGFRYFVNRVQPVLVRKGCMGLNCHSPLSLKLNLRGGSQGSFSSFARITNYRIAAKMLAFESADPNNSRIIAKNLFSTDIVPGAQGIAHRGGALLEDFAPVGSEANSATPDDCAGWDADTDDLNEIPAYCVLVRWHQLERQARIDAGTVDADDDLVRAVVYVTRPPGLGDPTDFDTYRPGADLRIADATVDADGSLTLGSSSSVLTGCGLSETTTDVRGTSVSWNGELIAFGARDSGDEPLRLFGMASDGTGCAEIPGVAASAAEENGILTHDFDPAYAPDGRLVFASTRGNVLTDGYDYSGPTRTPSQLQPNSNLYVHEPETDTPIRQLTFLLNQELQPAFMADGRVIFTAEKREPGFHQLALRRQILDGGDFHPLYAQRPSMGFGSATEVTQLPNLNFAFVASVLGAPDGAGTIAIFNRSIGPDQDDRDPGDRAFLHSMRVPMPGLLGGVRGLFRSPSALPTGRILVSCELTADSMGEGVDFGICELDPASDSVRVLLDEAGAAEVEAVPIYQRPSRGVLRSDGKGIDRPDILPGERDAEVHWNDFPMIASLMFENTRVARPLDQRIRALEVYETMPPPTGVTSFADVSGETIEDVFGPLFVSRRSLGVVPLFADGSGRMRVPGGTPLVFRLLGDDGEALAFPPGSPFEGEMIQREQEQYYPGERIKRSIPRRFFNAVCGGCHGSISGRELDIAVDLDVISGASINQARGADATDLVGGRY